MTLCELHNCDYRNVLPAIVKQYGKLDCMVMDPPYSYSARGAGKFRKERPAQNKIIEQNLDQGFDLNLLNWQTANAIIVFCNNEYLTKVLTRLEQGFYRRRVCMFHKKNPSPMCNKNYRSDTEFYVHAWQKGFEPTGAPQELLTHITAARTPKLDNPAGHPTPKPLDVMRKIMCNVPGQLILDPFMGTGTTGVAALEAGKDFIGCEIVPEYFKAAQNRISEVL